MLADVPISVLMTTYNCAPYIETAVQSILRQTYKNFELLIVDDGSSDNTEEIVRSIPSEKIRYARLEHLGRSAVLNYGLKAANNDWVALMDSDDIAVPERLEKESSLIRGNIKDIIFSDSVYFKDKEIQFLNEINPAKEDLKKKIKSRGHICNSSVIYNRNFILNQGGYNEKLNHSEDYELWLRLLDEANFVHLSDRLIFMRIRRNSLSKKINENPISKIPVFIGNNNPMEEKIIGFLASIREFFYRKKTKLRIKYFVWRLVHLKDHLYLTKKLRELDKLQSV
jgi:glycosyltransferase involved in cell wall biosynthesis